MLYALATLFIVTRAVHPEEIDSLKPPAIVTRSVPIVPAEIEERLRQYQNTRTAAFHGWSPDGKGILIATRFGNTAQLHRVYEPGGRREQITFFDEPVTGRFIPQAADGALLLSMSEGGSERDQIYLFTPKGGRAKRLTDGRSRNMLQAVTRDGNKLAFASNARNGRDTDLYVIEPRVPGSLKLVLKSDGQFWQAEDWSADGTKLLVLRYVSINESYPAILDVATGEKKKLPIPGKSPARSNCSASVPTRNRFTWRPTSAANSDSWRGSTWRRCSTRGSPKTSLGMSTDSVDPGRDTSPSRSMRTERTSCICWKATTPRVRTIHPE